MSPDPKLSSLPRSSLPFPDQILHLICQHLKNDKTTLLSVQKTSRAGWETATPHIYHRVKLARQADIESFFSGVTSGNEKGIARAKYSFSMVRYLELDHWDATKLFEVINRVAPLVGRETTDQRVLPNAKGLRFGPDAMAMFLFQENELWKYQVGTSYIDLWPKGRSELPESTTCHKRRPVFAPPAIDKESNSIALNALYSEIIAFEDLCIHAPRDNRVSGSTYGVVLSRVFSTLRTLVLTNSIRSTTLHDVQWRVWADPHVWSFGARMNRVTLAHGPMPIFEFIASNLARGMATGILASLRHRNKSHLFELNTSGHTDEPRWEIRLPAVQDWKDSIVTDSVETDIMDLMNHDDELAGDFEPELRQQGVQAVLRRKGDIFSIQDNVNATCAVCEGH